MLDRTYVLAIPKLPAPGNDVFCRPWRNKATLNLDCRPERGRANDPRLSPGSGSAL